MFFKLVVIGLLILIAVSLGIGLYHLMTETNDTKPDSKKVLTALTWRIGISVSVFILLLVGLALGWIQPHGIGQ